MLLPTHSNKAAKWPATHQTRQMVFLKTKIQKFSKKKTIEEISVVIELEDEEGTPAIRTA